MLLFVGAPVLGVMCVYAQELILVGFGDRWDEAVLPMQIITAAALVDLAIAPLSRLAEFSRALPRSTVLQWFRAGLTAVSVGIALAIRPTLPSVSGGVLVASVLTLGLSLLLVARPLNVRAGPLLQDLALAATVSVVSAGVAALAVSGMDHSGLRLLAGAILSICAYLVLCTTVARGFGAGPLLQCAAALGGRSPAYMRLERLLRR
jgi:hypothetical protein